MSAHTDYQTIDFNGQPAFVLVPWDQFARIRPLLAGDQAALTGIPQDVVEAHVLRDVPIIRAWREYLGLTQADLASRMGISQAAIAKFEKPGASPRNLTIKRVADALDLNPAQFDV